MMKRTIESSSAFPVPERSLSYGMTLRDWFAGQALDGMIRNNPNTDNMWVAEQCYRFADAMLEARK